MNNFRNKDRHDNKYHIPYNKPPSVEHGEKLTKGRPTERWDRNGQIEWSKLFPQRLEKVLKTIPAPTKAPAPDLWDGEGAFIHGEAGVGKTVSAANIAMDVRHHLWLEFSDKNILFTSVPQLFDRLKTSYGTDERPRESEIMREQETAWLLILDDLGAGEKPSTWLLQKLYLLIDKRYNDMIPTIITSNLDLSGLSKLYGDVRITSRINRVSTISHKKAWDRG